MHVSHKLKISIMILDKEKFKNYQCSQYKNEFDSEEEKNGIRTMSLGELEEAVCYMKRNAALNNKDIFDVPVFIESDNEIYCVEGSSISFGKIGITCSLRTEFEGKYNQRIHYVAPDERPDEGEYWESRGISDGLDVSGFVKSKKAGERLLRMVRLVLEKDETDSWLDYREYEPNWIQFKFKPSEFDLEKLDKLVDENNGIVTLDILKESVKKNN